MIKEQLCYRVLFWCTMFDLLSLCHIKILSCNKYIFISCLFAWFQGNPDHASGLQTKLGCNAAGQFPLYQAAMSLMEEVIDVIFAYFITYHSCSIID